jgi:hypothetical protein
LENISNPHFFKYDINLFYKTTDILFVFYVHKTTISKNKSIFEFILCHSLLYFDLDCKMKTCPLGGDSLSTVPSLGEEECRKKCQENPSCQLWIVSSGKCRLKTYEALISSNPCVKSNATAVSGTSLCPGNW